MHERIRARLEKIDVYYNAASPATRQKADEHIPWEKILKLEDGDRLLRHIRTYISDEAERREKNERTKALCKCADRACPAKRGLVPPQITPRRGGRDDDGPGVEVRVDNYVNGEHPDVVVAEAYDDYIADHAEILPALTRAAGLLENEVETSNGLIDA